MTAAKEKAEEIYWMFDANKAYALNCVNELKNDDVFFKNISETREHSKFWNEVESELETYD